jgi:outer membrane translocation and assembly module TamA
MGKLDVQGLDLFGEPAVKKLWALKEGSPYDENYPETFLTRIREEGYFDNLGKTRFESKVNATNNTVDVTLYFSGGPPAHEKRPGEQQAPP